MENSILLLSLFLVFIFGVFFSIALKGKAKNTKWKLKVSQKLTELDAMSKSSDTIHLKNVVTETDKLLDYVLKMNNIKGETLGERLMSATKHYDWNDYQKIWEAHKIRNKIAHELDFSPSAPTLESSYKTLKQAIKKWL